MSGQWIIENWKSMPRVLDVCACTRLRRAYIGGGLAHCLPRYGQDLCVPPACTVALSIAKTMVASVARAAWRVPGKPAVGMHYC